MKYILFSIMILTCGLTLAEEKKASYDDVKSNFFTKINKAIDGTEVIITNNKDGIKQSVKSTAPKVAVFIERESKAAIAEVKSGIAIWKWATIIGGILGGGVAIITILYYYKEWRKS